MFKIAAILFVALAGFVHIVIAPAHLAHAPAHGITFLLIGLTQILWGVAFIRFSRVGPVYWAGIALSGGVVLLWVLTQVFSPPFAIEAEPVDLPTLVSKTAEGIAFFALLLLGQKQHEQSGVKLIGGALVVIFIVGGGMLWPSVMRLSPCSPS